ncbi:MAG: hypothetical protein O3B73_09770 [bacterium]|nr:hypothetical protein [bacterium]
MTPQLLIFVGALIYLCWALVRYFKKKDASDDRPFIEVLDEVSDAAALPKSPPKPQKLETDGDREWRKRIRAEIEDLTK